MKFGVKFFNGESGVLTKRESLQSLQAPYFILFYGKKGSRFKVRQKKKSSMNRCTVISDSTKSPSMSMTRTYHQPQHQAAHSLSDLGRYVVAELLQRGQEALQLAELSGAASRWELLVGE